MHNMIGCARRFNSFSKSFHNPLILNSFFLSYQGIDLKWCTAQNLTVIACVSCATASAWAPLRDSLCWHAWCNASGMTDTQHPTRVRSNRTPAAITAVCLALALHPDAAAQAASPHGAIGGTGVIALTSPANAGPQTCALATQAAESRHSLPAGLMTAIASVESGRYDPQLQANVAWPWTINAEGTGSHFDSKADAIAHVSALRAGGMESIDVGCMQVNLRWHPDAFSSLDDAFDPAINAAYAADLLLRLFNQHGDWPTAIAHYHSSEQQRGANYAAKVAEAWAGLGGGFAGLPVAAAAPASASPPPGPTMFGGLVAAGGPGSGATGIAAPAPAVPSTGTVTRLTSAGSTNGGVDRASTGNAAEEFRFFSLERR